MNNTNQQNYGQFISNNPNIYARQYESEYGQYQRALEPSIPVITRSTPQTINSYYPGDVNHQNSFWPPYMISNRNNQYDESYRKQFMYKSITYNDDPYSAQNRNDVQNNETSLEESTVSELENVTNKHETFNKIESNPVNPKDIETSNNLTDDAQISSKVNNTARKQYKKHSLETEEYNEPLKKKKKKKSTKVRVFTGSIEFVIKWHKLELNDVCLYDVVARCISVDNGPFEKSKALLLRGDKGPVLKVTYYERIFPLYSGVIAGVLIRCIGRIVGNNKMIAFKIQPVSKSEKSTLQRFAFISDNTVTHIFK